MTRARLTEGTPDAEGKKKHATIRMMRITQIRIATSCLAKAFQNLAAVIFRHYYLEGGIPR